jgi:hypothetical protein
MAGTLSRENAIDQRIGAGGPEFSGRSDAFSAGSRFLFAGYRRRFPRETAPDTASPQAAELGSGPLRGGQPQLGVQRDRLAVVPPRGVGVGGGGGPGEAAVGAGDLLMTAGPDGHRQGLNRPAGDPGGDFATGNYKGQCAPGEYVAGVAYTGRFGSSRTPDALFCRS